MYTCSSNNICLQCFAGARLSHQLLTLQAQPDDKRQAEAVHAVALPASQEDACTISTAATALETTPAEAVSSHSDVATPLMVSATTTSAAAEHVTDATALLAGEPTASPIVLGDLDVASALRSPVPLAPASVASSGPAAPVGEDAASPSASLTGFGSPIVSPSSTAAATTTALPDAAVLSNEKAELAEPDTTLPEEPCTSLHAMAPAGPHESAMPALSPFGGTDPDSNTPGPAAVIAAGPPVNTSPVGPSADPSDQNAAPPADPPVSGEAGFGSPIALAAAPTTAAAAIGHHKHLLPCFTAFEQGHLLMPCKLPHKLLTVCRSQGC